MPAFTPTREQSLVINASAEQRTLVQAGPGTGKTEVVARRLAHLTGNCGLRPAQLLVLSFSRSAVKALIRRICSLEDAEPGTVEDLRFLSVRTFDSWTFRMLRFLGQVPRSLLQNDFEANIKLFLSELRKLGRAGLLRKKELRLDVVRHIVIDEYQDLTGVRAELVRKLLELIVLENEGCGFTVLGDPDQAIYDWSIKENGGGAIFTSRDLINWIRTAFEPQLAVRNLTRNHRAGAELARLISRASKLLRSCADSGESPVEGLRDMILRAGDEADVEDIYDLLAGKSRVKGEAVLCRYNSQILQLVTSLHYMAYKKGGMIAGLRLNAGTPPRTLPCWVAKLLHRYKAGQLSKTTFRKAFDLVFPAGSADAPCGGDPEATWRLLLGYARYGEGDTSLNLDELRERIYWPDSLPDDEGESDDVITLTTIHQSKGLEYRTVRVVEGGSVSGEEDGDEEGRVLFVGMSRARDQLGTLKLNDRFPFYLKEFDDGRKRWHRWIFGNQQLELGCDGDVNQASIVRSDLMGGPDAVKRTQELLANSETRLIGLPVTLEKEVVPERAPEVHYKITVEIDDDKWCLGFMNKSVTYDLLKLRTKGGKLPGRIYNLRIGAITTSTGGPTPHRSVPSPWRESRFWLSACIHGVGQCKTY